MHQSERRARDVFGHAVSATNRLHQRRLSGSEIPGDGDDNGRFGHASEAPPPFAKLVFGDGELPVTGERGEEGIVGHSRPAPTFAFPFVSRRARSSNS